MKAFEISEEQIASIVGALVADELGFRFRRHIDGPTVASLSPDTRLGDGGLQLKPEELAACAARAASFFGASPETLPTEGVTRISEWSGRLHLAVQERLTTLTFMAAGRGEERRSALHHAADVFADAAAVSGLTFGRRRLISLVAPHSHLGFVLTILTPNLQLIPRIDARGMSPELLTKTLSFGDAVVATPSLWRYLLQEGARAPDNVMAIYFGEAMSRELAKEMRDKGFSSQREVYGSTETGLIGWRDTPGEPFRLFDRIVRAGDGLARRRAGGDETLLDTPDAINWREARTFDLGPRRDGAVQIGAVNVFPDRIAAVIEAHQDVASCRIEVGRHTGGFDRLIARIALKEELAVSEGRARSIERHCRDTLLPHERPRIYRFEVAGK